MRYMISATVAFGATLVAAQSAADIPSCALPCFINNIPKVTSCTVLDTACQCMKENQDNLKPVITPCVLSACSQDDALKTNSVSMAICAKANGGTSGSSSSSGSMMSSASGTASGSVSATFTSLNSVGALGGGAQATGATTSDSNISLNGGVATSSTMTAKMSGGPQVPYFTAGAVPAMPTRLAAAVGGVAGLVGVLAI